MKKKLSKWSMDEFGNVEGEGRFFHISDIKCIYFFEEKETCSLLITLLPVQIQLGYNLKEKTNVLKIRNWLQEAIRSYQKTMKKHRSEHHNIVEEMVKLQKKAVSKCHE